MTKHDLCIRISKRTGMELNKTKDFLEAAVDEIKTSMSEGHYIAFRGFGTFQIVERKAKAGRNLLTNTYMPVPARKVVKFRPYDKLNDLVK